MIAGRRWLRSGRSGTSLLRDAVSERGGEQAGVFEEAVDWGVAREGFYQRQAGAGVLLARFEERLEQHQVGDQVDQRVSGDVLAGPSAPELALVAGQDGGREIVPGVRLVGPGGREAT